MKKNLLLLYIAFTVSLVITLVISNKFSEQFYLLIKYNSSVERTENVLTQIAKVQYKLLEAESNQRGFLISRDSVFLREFVEDEKSIYKEMDSLKKLIKGSQVQERNIIKLKAAAVTRLQILNKVLDDIKPGKLDSFQQSVMKGKKVMDDFLQQAAKMEREERQYLAEGEKLRNAYAEGAPVYLKLSLIVSLFLQMITFLFLIIEFRRRHKYQQKLEKNFHDLQYTNAELQQITFIASHDLQEPLRKVRTFSEMLIIKNKNVLKDESRMMLERIDYSAERMQGLITDLVNYTSLLNTTEVLKKTDLKVCVALAETTIQDIYENKVKIDFTNLPLIKGNEYQLTLLFKNLFENAAKFAKENMDPRVNISYQIIKATDILDANGLLAEQYYKLTIADNGIGFSNEFAKKIFDIFQRLHSQQSSYKGKGIGLAICKRIMINHGGFITADGEPGMGANFHLYFPKQDV